MASRTRVAAAMAPFSSISMRSILARFQASFAAARLAMKRGVLSSTTCITRSWLARSEEPVSETSTMASARIGGLTSVAPQENSTLAFTPCSARKRFVMPTASVAMWRPSRSFTVWYGEPSLEAITQRTVP
jgi:hypothetical protein